MTVEKHSSGFVAQHIFGLTNSNIHSLPQAHDKLKQLIAEGHDKLQILADFDFTLSNYCCPDGSRASSTHALLENENTRKLLGRYLPIEYDRNLTVEEKIPHMIQWWTESHKEIVADNLDKDKLKNLVKNAASLHLRAGFVAFFELLEKHSIPIVIFSGGIGDIIKIIIEEKLQKLPDNVHIISNWMSFDGEDKVTGFKNPIVHSFNKNSSVIKEEDKNFFENLHTRPNVLLLGDSLGDAGMDVGLEREQTVLKLGFLNVSVDKFMDDYLKTFDIVCVEDQTLTAPMSILEAICGDNTSRTEILNKTNSV